MRQGRKRIPKTKLPPKPVPKRVPLAKRLASGTTPRPETTLRHKEWHDELGRLLAAGWTVRSAAERLKITENAVYIAMRKAEVDGRPIARSVRSKKLGATEG